MYLHLLNLEDSSHYGHGHGHRSPVELRPTSPKYNALLLGTVGPQTKSSTSRWLYPQRGALEKGLYQAGLV